MKSNLKNCPFCGKKDALYICEEIDESSSVYCNNCGAEGPQAASEDEAVVVWNRRNPNVVVVDLGQEDDK